MSIKGKIKKIGSKKSVYKQEYQEHGDLTVRKEDPQLIREKYNDGKYKESDYTRVRLRAFSVLGYTHARVGAKGRTVVYGDRIEPRFADFLELEDKEKEYKIVDLLNAKK